jgi:hypothetical protein
MEERNKNQRLFGGGGVGYFVAEFFKYFVWKILRDDWEHVLRLQEDIHGGIR